MSGGGGSPSHTTSVTKQELPAYAQPYAEQLLQRGTALSNQPYTPYTGQRIADFTPDQLAGLGMTRERAMSGAPDVNAARDMLAQTSSGAFLRPESNPYLKDTVDAALGQVQGRVNAQFNRPGAFGGTGHQNMLTDQLAQVATNLYGQNYMNERTNQLRAASMAPSFSNLDYQDAQALLGVGDVFGQREQDLLNLGYERFLEQQNFPFQQLDVLSNTLAGSTGGRSTTISQGAPVQYNRAASALGGGLLGAGLGSMAFPQSSYAPWIGGGLGALGGFAF